MRYRERLRRRTDLMAFSTRGRNSITPLSDLDLRRQRLLSTQADSQQEMNFRMERPHTDSEQVKANLIASTGVTVRTFPQILILQKNYFE